MQMSDRKQIIFEPGYTDENDLHVPGSWDAYMDGDYVGSRPTQRAAQDLLDAYVHAGLQRGTIRTCEQLDNEVTTWETEQAHYDEQAAIGREYLRTLGTRMAEYEAAQAAGAA
ncbi:MAG: hypothetical protein M3R24_41610 [Chloroflexota bacterium]|nr:hypothetical protein [Chloroflexota bacterium]